MSQNTTPVVPSTEPSVPSRGVIWGKRVIAMPALALLLAACGGSSGGSVGAAGSAGQLQKILASAPNVRTFRLTFQQKLAAGATSSSSTETSVYDLPARSYSVTVSQASGTPTLELIRTPTAQYVRKPGEKWIEYIVPSSLIASVGQPGQSMRDLIPEGAKVFTQSQHTYDIDGTLSQVRAGTNDIPSALSSLLGSATGSFEMTVSLGQSGLPVHEHDEITFTAGSTGGALAGDRSYSDYNTAPAVTPPAASAVARTIRVSSLAQLQSLTQGQSTTS